MILAGAEVVKNTKNATIQINIGPLFNKLIYTKILLFVNVV